MRYYNDNLICPVCLNLREWQYALGLDPYDFCTAHRHYRFEPLPGYTDEQIAQARQEAAGSAFSYYYFLPDIHHRCTSCGAEWFGNEDAHYWVGCPVEVSYTPTTISPWDSNNYALPKQEGNRRRS